MIKLNPDNYFFILLSYGLIVTPLLLLTWPKKDETDPWLRPVLVFHGLLSILTGLISIIYDIYTDQLKTDSKFFYTAVTSVCLGMFAVYTAYSKRKAEIKNAWRLPLIFIGGLILIMFGVFLLGVMFFSTKYASIFVGALGLIEILISLKILRKNISEKWLFPLTLLGGIVTSSFGIVTYLLFLGV